MSLILIWNLLFLDKMKLSHSLCLICTIYFIHWYISPVRYVYFLPVLLYVLVNCLQNASVWFVKTFDLAWRHSFRCEQIDCLVYYFSICGMHLLLCTIDWLFVFVLLSCLFLDFHLLFTSFGIFTYFCPDLVEAFE